MSSFCKNGLDNDNCNNDGDEKKIETGNFAKNKYIGSSLCLLILAGGTLFLNSNDTLSYLPYTLLAFSFSPIGNATVKVTLDQCNSNYLLNSTQLIAGHTRCRFLCKIHSLTQPNPIHPLLLLATKVLLDFQSQPNPIHLKPLVLHPSLTAILYYKCSATSS